jgi:anthranilate phosphoribosyltransferase
MAEALHLLGTRRAAVVHGEDGLDEVTLAGPTRVTEVTPEGLRNFSWTPSDFGLSPTSLESLQVMGPEDSARVIRGVLADMSGPPRDIVVLNAAAALWLAGKADSPSAAAGLAAEAIKSGAALALLERLGKLSHQRAGDA